MGSLIYSICIPHPNLIISNCNNIEVIKYLLTNFDIDDYVIEDMIDSDDTDDEIKQLLKNYLKK